MDHEISLIATIAVSLALAFVFGFAAQRLRLPPVLGYLLAGVAIGLVLPGSVAVPGTIGQIAFATLSGIGLAMSCLPPARSAAAALSRHADDPLRCHHPQPGEGPAPGSAVPHSD